MDEFVLNHNWRSPLSVRLEWQTSIHAAVNGKERRVALRRRPKVYFTYHISDQLSYFEMRALSESTGFLTPLWWSKSKVKNTAPAGDSEVVFEDEHFRVPPYIWTQAHGFLKVYRALSSPGRITLEDDLIGDMPAGMRVWAAYPVKVVDAPVTTFITGTLSDTQQLAMMVLGEYDYPDSMPVEDVADYFAHTQPNKVTPDTTTTATLFQDFLGTGGADHRFILGRHTRETHSFQYTLTTKDRIYRMWEVLGAMRGQEEEFYLATWRLLPLRRVLVGALEFDAAPGLLDLLQNVFLLAHKRDGTVDQMYVDQSSEGQGVIISVTDPPDVYDPSKTAIMTSSESRLAQDSVEFLYITSEVAQINLSFIEL